MMCQQTEFPTLAAKVRHIGENTTSILDTLTLAAELGLGAYSPTTGRFVLGGDVQQDIRALAGREARTDAVAMVLAARRLRAEQEGATQ